MDRARATSEMLPNFRIGGALPGRRPASGSAPGSYCDLTRTWYPKASLNRTLADGWSPSCSNSAEGHRSASSSVVRRLGHDHEPTDA